MGRLTLNVLLSFARFEREVTAERIRDKTAASKKKGMWIGGPLPLGYDKGPEGLLISEPKPASVRAPNRRRVILARGAVSSTGQSGLFQPDQAQGRSVSWLA